MAANKSGVATKKKFIRGAEIVDEDYTGEIHIHLFNNGTETQTLHPGDKVIQFILVPVLYENIEIETDISNMWSDRSSERGSNGFGSTGTK